MLYLASRSYRRQRLLKILGIGFKIIKPKIREEIKGKEPKKLALLLAEKKAQSVAHKVKRGLVLGVDTIVVVKNKILGKPKSKGEAREMLQLLSGKTHRVISGVCLIVKPENKIIKGLEETKVKFRKLTKREIENYIKTKEPYDKAGGYAIQGRGRVFIAKIKGSYQNVIGLPLPKVLNLIEGVRLRTGRQKQWRS